MKNKAIQSFYRSFYGDSFHRFFRRIPEFVTPRIKKEFFASNPIQLWFYVGKHGLGYPCYISIYDYGNEDNLKNKNNGSIKIDRVFLDFDIDNSIAKQIKNELNYIRSQGPDSALTEQNLLIKKASDLVINENIAEPAINEAKIFAETFYDEFDVYPSLFFSGFKGCHAYCFFEPLKIEYSNETITYFASRFKNIIALDTMDLSVNRDATSRLSRVPYSKHHVTGLTVVPFNITDNYEKIIEKAINPIVEPFTLTNQYCALGKHLFEIGRVIGIITRSRKNNSKKINPQYININNLVFLTIEISSKK